jgi:hypothetical protein
MLRFRIGLRLALGRDLLFLRWLLVSSAGTSFAMGKIRG